MLSVAALGLILPLVASYDLVVGLNSYGTKIYEADRRASPAIWRQAENVTVVAPDNEVIAKVLVIDMRPEKDGDASIVDGGEKQKSITIELKSPTVLRGYDFHIEVYAAPEEQLSETGTTEISTDTTDTPSYDSSPTVKCSTDSIVETKETTEAESTDTIRETRRVMENESNDTEINIHDEIDTTNSEATTVSDLTTLSDISTTGIPDLQTFSNLPDFPLTGMERDETRHVRKIGDDLFTSTVDSLYPTVNVDTTITPNAFDDYNISAVSDISTTQQSDEAFTVPPNTLNGKDIPDFDDLLSSDGGESRLVRHVSSEDDLEDEYNNGTNTTNIGDFSTTEKIETTTLVPINFNDFENETRNSREAVINQMNGVIDTTEFPQINDGESQVPPLLQIMTGNRDYNINETTAVTDEDESVTESSGDFSLDVSDTTGPPDSATTPVQQQVTSSDSFTEEQLRVGRGIVEESGILMPDMANGVVTNYPLFIDPAILSKPNVSDEYVYVPILAVISKNSYPVFRAALDNISMNVAFPSNNLDANTAVEQQMSLEIPVNKDTDQKPITSLT